MSALHGKISRRMLPRWRTSVRAAQSPEFSALKRPRPVQSDNGDLLREIAVDFSKSPSLGIAADLISNALLAGQTNTAESAARFVIEHQDESPKALLLLAKSVVEPTGPSSELSPAILNVAAVRRLLRLHPDNALLWSDMARHHASLGDKGRAYKCMQAALQLAPNHRWMIRTMSRFMVHQGDPVAAHKLLASHPKTRTDPWLIAAELACAQVAGKAPKYWRQATDILKHEAVSPFHISELATSVAMIELEGSERKRARKYIQKGLVSPTENTLAQVFWAKENKHLSDGFKLDELVGSTADAYEADYQLNWLKGELLTAIRSARIWSGDEPFAARPKAEIAYAASLLDDYDLTIQMADEVKRLDGQVDLNLEMNRICAVLSSGRLSRINDTLEIERYRSVLVNAIAQGNENSYHAMANLGLWNYRYGDSETGQLIYQQAIESAIKLHLKDAAASASTFAAREAILAKSSTAPVVLESAKALAKKSGNKANDFYLRKLDALIVDVGASKEILSANSASRFLRVTPPPPPKMRIERTKDGVILWLPPKKIG